MTNPADNPWTPEQDAMLTRMWADGDTVARIADATGRTRNAVIGRRQRLHLPGRSSPIREAISKPKRVTRPPMPSSAPREPATVFKARAPMQCSWIENDRAPWVYCNEPTQERSSFCPAHHARCWRRAAA